MTEHTKGPWEIVGDSLRGDSYVAISGEGWEEFATVVTRMKHKKRDNPEGVANARLIAAAPELLEALEIARDHLEVSNYEGEEDELLAKIGALLVKIEGDAA